MKPHQRIAGGNNGGNIWKTSWSNSPTCCGRTACRVSLAETLDAVKASDVTGLGERDLFRAALRATMIKRASELPVFEELFDVYFTGLGEIIKGASKGGAGRALDVRSGLPEFPRRNGTDAQGAWR